jgi:hypothetical protein
MVSLIRFGEVILSADDLLNLQVVISIMPKMGFLYLSTAYSAMGYPSNSSSSKETQIQPFAVAAFMEIRSTSNVAYESPTSKRRALFRLFSTFAAYARRSLMSC